MRPPPYHPRRLLADAQPFDQLLVPAGVLALEVVEQPAPLADELEQPAPRVVVLLVGLEVLRELVDPLREQGHLHLRRPGVLLVRPELLDDHALAFRVDHVTAFPSASGELPQPSPWSAEGYR